MQYKKLKNGNLMLTRDYTIRYRGFKFTIRTGFIWDGASIPKMFHWFQKPDSEKLLEAALLHDVLYLTRAFNRLYSDWAFTKLSKAVWYKKIINHIFLRVGAWWAYYDQSRWDIERIQFVSIQWAGDERN